MSNIKSLIAAFLGRPCMALLLVLLSPVLFVVRCEFCGPGTVKEFVECVKPIFAA